MQNYPQIQKRLLVKVIELNPTDALAYNNLGAQLSRKEKILVWRNGESKWARNRDLYKEAIELDNGCVPAYRNLALTLPNNHLEIELQLKEGATHFRKSDLLLKAIKLDSACASAYRNLGLTLPNNRSKIQVQLNGKTGETIDFTKRDLFLEAIRLDNGHALTYLYLGLALPNERSRIWVDLKERPRYFTQRDLFKEAIRLDNDCASAYRSLGLSLPTDDSEILVQQGDSDRWYTKRELLLPPVQPRTHWRDPSKAGRRKLELSGDSSVDNRCIGSLAIGWDYSAKASTTEMLCWTAWLRGWSWSLRSQEIAHMLQKAAWDSQSCRVLLPNNWPTTCLCCVFLARFSDRRRQFWMVLDDQRKFRGRNFRVTDF